MGGAQSGVLNWSKVRLSGAFQPRAMTPDLGMAAVALVPGYSLELHLASLKRLSSFPRFPKSAVPHPQPLTPKKWVRGPALGALLIGRWWMSRAEKNSQAKHKTRQKMGLTHPKDCS